MPKTKRSLLLPGTEEERAYRIEKAKEVARDFWRNISTRLGVIAHGEEYGLKYAVPADEREIAQLVLRELTERLNGKN
jgi:hypothetical protein